MFAITMGSLGIKRFKDTNISLLFKWLEAFGDRKEKLWKNIIMEKYGKDLNDWYKKRCLNAHGCGF